MTLRKVPGALALGLLASLAAHAGIYGGEHAMGGAYHELIVQLTLAGGISLLVFFAALAWGESAAADGSVLAARLRERLPGLGAVFAAAALCYIASEALEPHHAAAPPIAALLALAAAAWLVLRLASGLARVLASVVIAIWSPPFAPRAPSWKRQVRRRPSLRRILVTRRRFARPPPITALNCA
ncbi:MAG: hypothetical protein JO113_01940 [Candidatus Eremiobacteraeota bacterium]|nr:hypothetical protein [Candidatus Eremiobacteraeota bacterium]